MEDIAQGITVVEGPAPVGREEVCRRIASYLRDTEVERAILFGSFARGTQDVASDIDLVLIEPTDRPFLERGLNHLPLFRLGLGLGLDLLVYTPEEFERLLREGNPLIERAVREGVEVHARR